MKIRRVIYIGGAFLLVMVKFAFDVIGKNIDIGGVGFQILRELLAIAIFVLIFLTLEGERGRRALNPIRTVGFLLLALAGVLVAALILTSMPAGGFDAKELGLIPLDYPTLFIASLLSLIIGIFAVVVLRALRDLILHIRKKGTRRTLLAWIVVLLAATASTVMLKPLDVGVLTTVLGILTIIAGIANSFRLHWIVYLTKREKVYGLVYGFFLFLGFIGLNVLLSQGFLAGRSLLYYSHPAQEFAQLTFYCANIYFGMAFVSTLFHIPTADAFERKRSEVTSLSSLGKLVTQVLDFNELVDTVTTMTMQVCEAKSCWLEIIRAPEEGTRGGEQVQTLPEVAGSGPPYHVQVVALKNITRGEIEDLVPVTRKSLRDAVMVERKPLLVDDCASDPRFKGTATKLPGSIVVVPLLSHVGLIGVLYATKETAYGFVKDDLDLISAFADQASVAIENSNLIKKSIERERLLKEIMVAQEMQKKLLPQSVPQSDVLQIDAVSTPAFEVGGDYYDFMELEGDRLGIIVGDVSGKGVSAAFYMSEVKGIFQALGRMYTSPREFMISANAALAGSIDKHSFVSLIYGIVDLATGSLVISRAGHCPMLYVSGNSVAYIRPTGMGLGLTTGELFGNAMEEHTLTLREGDVCLFYTDGVTEARHDGDEFGYDRLLALVQRIRHKSASEIKNEVLQTVQNFTGNQPTHDDLTLVVLKWLGSRPEDRERTSIGDTKNE